MFYSDKMPYMFTKDSFLTVLLIISSIAVLGQSSSNYTIGTNRNGVWHPMGGSTQIMGPNNDEDSYSPFYVDLGFRFLFMGEFWDEFKISANGVIWFGNATDFFPNGANNIGEIPNSRRISALANQQGMRTQTRGDVKIVTKGTAPNRYAVVRWRNMGANRSSTTNDITYQVVFHESEYNSDNSGKFEFIYNNVSWGVSTGEKASCGFQVDDEADKRFTVNIENDSYSSTTAKSASPAAGTLANLNSTASATKKQYYFNANNLTANNSGITASCISANSLLLTWDDNLSTNLGYAIYISQNGTDYTFLQNEGADASSATITGLAPDTQFWFRVHAFNEGKFDQTGGVTTATTLSAGNITAISSGNWSDASIWSGGQVPASADNVTIGCIDGYDVRIDATAQCNDLTIEPGSSVAFATSKEFYVNGKLLNNGTFDYSSAYTKCILRGDLINNGIWNAGSNSQTIFNGAADQAINNSQFSAERTSVEASGAVPVNDWQWASFPVSVPAGVTYQSLSSVELDIDHTYNSDLRVFLRNPAGEEVCLAYKAGGSGDNYRSAVFRDNATVALPAYSTSISGTYLPKDRLSGFSAIQPGQWTVWVYDDASGDRGEIKRVKLTFNAISIDKKLALDAIEINNNGGKVTSNTNIAVNGYLKLSNGVLDMFGSSTVSSELYLSEQATADPAHDNTYVFGKIIKKGNSDFSFPVGDGGFAANAEIRFAGGSASDEFSVCYFHQSPSQRNIHDPNAPYSASAAESTIKEISGNEYWLIEQEKNAGTPVYIFLSYQHGRSGDIQKPGDLVVTHYTDDNFGSKFWKNEGLSSLSSSQIASLAPISSFSPFTIGTSNGSNTLPVEWLSFKVTGKDNRAEINWAAMEYADCEYYQIERSLNGTDFEPIARISIDEEGEQHHSYEHVLSYYLAGTEVYFRIKQVDYDGKESFSKIDSYRFSIDETAIELYPLPATTTVTVKHSQYEGALGNLTVLNSKGQKINIRYKTGRGDAVLDVSALPSGIYIMQFAIGNEIVRKNFIVQ